MYQSIVIPIDLANDISGKEMIAQAKAMAAHHAKVHFVHVIESIPVYMEAEIPSRFLTENNEAAKKQMQAIASEAGLDSEVVIRNGSAATEILEEAEAMGADLILVKSHKPGLQDYFLGSTASRVVRHAKCSVLVMR